MFKYYDTHAHLNDPCYNLNQQKVYLAGIITHKVLVNVVGFDLQSSHQAVFYAQKYPDFFRACVGIHPNNVACLTNPTQTLKDLAKLIKTNRNQIVAMGEIGIDLYRSNNLNVQKQFLNAQLELAHLYHLPVMFHIRDGFEAIQPFIIKYTKWPKIIHCFSTNWNQAMFYLQHNCFLSIPGIVTFAKAKLLQEAIKHIPLTKLLVETDAPYLTPVPLRGQINYSHYIQHTVAKIALLKQMPHEEVRTLLLANALALFRT